MLFLTCFLSEPTQKEEKITTEEKGLELSNVHLLIFKGI